jgi:hypothetical protein
MLRFAQLCSAFAILVAFSACHSVAMTHRRSEPVVAHHPGPPPHAPAHGHRHKHPGGVDLRFDAELGVYAVVRHTEMYFNDGWFLRIRGGVWQVSATLEGPWKPRSSARVPPGLRAKHHAKKAKKHSRRGRGAAKGK